MAGKAWIKAAWLSLLLAAWSQAWTAEQLRGQSADLKTLHAYSGLEGDNYELADDALSTNVGNLYSFTAGLVPSGRVKHVLVFVEPFVIVFGGYAQDGSLLDDVQMYDTRSRAWSGVVLRRQCCDSNGQVVETSGLQAADGIPLGGAGTYPGAPPGVKDAFALPIVNPYQEGSKIGFQGDLPIPRAEHAGAEANGLAYIFGGVTQAFGLSSDFYSYDPVNIQWRVLNKYSGNTPARRAGHSLTTDYSGTGVGPQGKRLYLFGGRSIQSGFLTGLNDVWSFDTQKLKWTCATCVASTSPDSSIYPQPTPVGRQYHAAAMANGHLIIYGGIDPLSNLTLNDIWAFHVGTKVWQQLAVNSGQTGGFAPPPLYHASLLSLTPTTQGANSTGFISNAFLLYGGLGGGGSCGAHKCGLLETVLGQVYRLKITYLTLGRRGARANHTAQFRFPSSSVPLDSSGGQSDEETMYIDSDPQWEYARLTGQGYDRGRLIKRYGMESVCLDNKRGILYEMGGMQARSTNLAQTDKQETLLINLGGDFAYLDSGEQFDDKLWDRSTGEHIRQTNQQPTNGPWTFEDGFTRFQPLLNSSLKFLPSFRVHTVSPVDVVEAWTQTAEPDTLSQ